MNKWVFTCFCLGIFNVFPLALQAAKPYLTTLHLVDRNGISETISNKERLKQFQRSNFLDPQPYQKVVRIYNRNNQGDIQAYLTTYHSNGQIKQYLEIFNSRAKGLYQEWHINGQIKLSAKILGGDPDVEPEAQKSWLFDDKATVYNEEGQTLAIISYSHGELEGDTCHYYPNNTLKKRLPYKKNLLHGAAQVYDNEGTLKQRISYNKGEMEGEAISYHENGQLAFKEVYLKNKLQEGIYYDVDGTVASSVSEGSGKRTLFDKNSDTKEVMDYLNGIPKGEVSTYQEGSLQHTYHILEGLKHGKETFYSTNNLPKLSIDWYEGKIHGTTTTYYENGQKESQKEMSNNKKNGIFTAWYLDGSLMMIEEYHENRLVSGKYYHKNQDTPKSTITEGSGTATLYDEHGFFRLSVNYKNGAPEPH